MTLANSYLAPASPGFRLVVLYSVHMAITPEQFYAACHSRDEEDRPLNAQGEVLSAAYLAADPEFDWDPNITWITSADVVSRLGRHDGCCKGAYG